MPDSQDGTPAKAAATKTTAAKTTAAKTTAAKKAAPAKRTTGRKTAPARKTPARRAPARTKAVDTAVVPPAPVHLSLADRQARGADARSATTWPDLAGFDPGTDRPDPVALLESQSASRVPDLVPIRYGRMMESPFSFYRGAALVMATDLSRGPRTGLDTQLCGDAHLSNFGGYGSQERRLVFDVNDFDETNPGPFEWDVKRMVTSFEIACRQNGYSDKARKQIVLTAAASYRVAMSMLAALGEMDTWYSTVDVQSIADAIRASKRAGARKQAKQIDAEVARARRHSAMQAVAKLTDVVDGRRRFVSQPPLVVPISDLTQGHDLDITVQGIHQTFLTYRHSLQPDRRHLLEQFEYVDMARKVVGVGSVGTRCWILLLTGRDADDLQILQVKEADRSVLEDVTQPSVYANHAQRVVEGQRLMQSSSDLFLGWAEVPDPDGVVRHYYFRQLRDWKVSAEVETMDAPSMEQYAQLCGATLAKAHARGGDRVAIAAYVGLDDSKDKPNGFDKAMRRFAIAYADQNARDHQALVEAVREGRIVAEPGI